jgi:Na+-driven multidrug efflux pump
MRKQQRFSLHCLPGCGTIAVLRQGSTTMKTTAMTAEERVRYMTQAPVRRLILEMSAPTVILCTMLLQTIGMAWQASVVAAARQGLFLIPVVFILPNLLGLAGVEYAQPAADLLAFALALPMGLSVLKTFRSDAPTPAHTLREE